MRFTLEIVLTVSKWGALGVKWLPALICSSLIANILYTLCKNYNLIGSKI